MMQETVLEKILIAKRAAVEKSRNDKPLSELMRWARDVEPPRDFKAALMAKGLSVIAEVKRASPSRGVIAKDIDVGRVAQQYHEGGAAAISVLTEEDFFFGGIEDLRCVKASVPLPVLRKDFIVEPYQVWESKVIGADAILLLGSVLELSVLRQLIVLARQLELATLVEIHNEVQLGKAMNAGADVIGVNARDLHSFSVDLRVPLALASIIPPGIIKVAESGVKTPDDAAQFRDAGYDAILVGETLMRSENPAQTLRDFMK